MDPTVLVLVIALLIVAIALVVMAFKAVAATAPAPAPIPVDDSKPHLQFTVFYPHLQLSIQGVTHMILTDSQQVVFSVQPVDKRGNPTTVAGVPAWTVSDPTLGTLNVAADGLSATFLAVGPLGHVQVAATLVDGATTLSGTAEIDIVAGAAATLNLTAGTPSEQ
jgi:hypothetical protein